MVAVDLQWGQVIVASSLSGGQSTRCPPECQAGVSPDRTARLSMSYAACPSLPPRPIFLYFRTAWRNFLGHYLQHRKGRLSGLVMSGFAQAEPRSDGFMGAARGQDPENIGQVPPQVKQSEQLLCKRTADAAPVGVSNCCCSCMSCCADVADSLSRASGGVGVVGGTGAGGGTCASTATATENTTANTTYMTLTTRKVVRFIVSPFTVKSRS